MEKPDEDEGEQIVQMPLDREAKARLVARARANGRAVGREAAMIVKAALAAGGVGE